MQNVANLANLGNTGATSGIYSLQDNVVSLSPEFYLPLDETSGAIAKNKMYTTAIGSDLFGDFSFDGSGRVTTPLSEAGYSEGVQEGNEVATGELHADHPTLGGGYLNMFGSSATPGAHVVRRLSILTIGDTYRATVVVETVDSGATAISYENASNWGMPPNTISTAQTYVVDDIASAMGFGLKNASTGYDTTFESLSVQKIGELDGEYTGNTLDGATLLGRGAPTFDGSNDFIQLENNRLESVFNPAEGTLVCAFKLTSAEWQDSNVYSIYRVGVDANNLMEISKSTANTLTFSYTEGSTGDTRDITVGSSEYGKWLLAIARFSTTGNETTLDIQTQTDTGTFSIGTWTASALTSAFCILGKGGGFFPNAIGQVSLFSRSITDAEVSLLHELFRQQEHNSA